MSLSEGECHFRKYVIVGCPYVMWYLPVEEACSSWRRCVFGGGVNLKRGYVFVGEGVYLWAEACTCGRSTRKLVIQGYGVFLWVWACS